MQFRDRVAVITGGASGIGEGCAARLQQEGARVVTWDISDRADVFCDVRDESSIDSAITATIAEYGVPSILVAAAGIGGPFEEFHKLPLDGWDEVMSVNLRGVFLSMRAVANAMIDANLDGAMVVISSVNGVIADPVSAPYSATKAAVYHLCRVAAIDLGPYGIRVNGVGPGPTDTPLMSGLTSTDNYVQEVEAATPLGRIGTPELVADGVVNILRSDWITGQAIMLDGGSSLATARGRVRAKAHAVLNEGAKSADRS